MSGNETCASVAGPPSPGSIPGVNVPVPATRSIVPEVVTRVTFSWPGSAMYSVPSDATAMPPGASVALFAAP